MWQQEFENSSDIVTDSAVISVDRHRLGKAEASQYHAHSTEPSSTWKSHPEQMPQLYSNPVLGDSLATRGFPLSSTNLCGGKYDSSRTDSGCFSGTITSEQCLSSTDELVSQDSGLVSPTSRTYSSSSGSKSYMRLDSGVDVGLHEQLSSLSLKSTNDLNSSVKDRGNSLPLTTLNNFAPSTTSASEGYVSSPVSSATPCTPVSPTLPSIQNPLQPKLLSWQDFFTPDEEGDTYLHIAILKGFIEVVFSLVSMVPDSSYLDCLNDMCQTPLHLAVLTKQPQIVRRLVVANARVDIRNRDGNTALHLACELGDLACIRALSLAVNVDEVAVANLLYPYVPQPLPQVMDERNYDGQMCIHLATMHNHCDALRGLCWLKADTNVKEGKSGRTPLHYAAERGNLQLGKLLIASGADVNAQTYAGYTPYQLACYTNRELAEELVRAGAFPTPLPESDYEWDSDDSMDEMSAESFFKDLQQPINIAA